LHSSINYSRPNTAGDRHRDRWPDPHRRDRRGRVRAARDACGVADEEIGPQTFQLNLVADQQRGLTLGATTVTSVQTRGQNVRYTFTFDDVTLTIVDSIGQRW
jgi:hypothetical protein